MSQIENISPTFGDIAKLLKILGLNIGISALRWEFGKNNRFYHTEAHILDLYQKWIDSGKFKDDPEIFLTIVFHDVVYDPMSDINEEQSAAYFQRIAKENHYKNQTVIDNVTRMILETKTHKATTEKSKYFCELDLSILSDPFNKQMEFEHNIFKEFQFVDFKVYKEKRVEILKKLHAKSELIDYVNDRKVNIGLYAGSFNPFHKGHMNIVYKAENIFDKVIIANGKNVEKAGNVKWERPAILKYRQVEDYEGFLTTFIQNLGYPVTLIRGLRNASDFTYETTFYRYLQDQMPDIKVVSITSNAEYEHYSSSGIKTVHAFDPELAKTYLP